MIIELTKQLLEWNEKTRHIFSQGKKTADFEQEILPFVEQVDKALEEWRKVAEAWVKQEQPKYVHLLQVEQTYENLKTNALECFATVKPKRFLQRHKAVEYVLQSIVTQVRM